MILVIITLFLAFLFVSVFLIERNVYVTDKTTKRIQKIKSEETGSSNKAKVRIPSAERESKLYSYEEYASENEDI